VEKSEFGAALGSFLITSTETFGCTPRVLGKGLREVIHNLLLTRLRTRASASRLLAMSLAQQKYALDTREPFTRADARGAGITVKELISSRYQKVFYNIYVSAHVVVTPQIRARAALRLASPDSYASHHTAAELWGTARPPR